MNPLNDTGMIGGMEGTPAYNYTFAEAVRIANCSESTLRRKLKAEGRKLGATYNGRSWQIPVTTLEALGVLDTVQTPPDDTEVTPIDDSQRMADLERELAVYKERASQQEKRIADLQAQLETTNTAMRLIEASRPTQPEQSRGLFARLFGR